MENYTMVVSSTVVRRTTMVASSTVGSRVSAMEGLLREWRHGNGDMAQGDIDSIEQRLGLVLIEFFLSQHGYAAEMESSTGGHVLVLFEKDYHAHRDIDSIEQRLGLVVIEFPEPTWLCSQKWINRRRSRVSAFLQRTTRA